MLKTKFSVLFFVTHEIRIFDGTKHDRVWVSGSGLIITSKDAFYSLPNLTPINSFINGQKLNIALKRQFPNWEIPMFQMISLYSIVIYYYNALYCTEEYLGSLHKCNLMISRETGPELFRH